MHNPLFPLVDIHRHLDGNIRPKTIWDHAQQFNISLPASSMNDLRPYVQVTKNEPSLVAFLSKLDWGIKTLGNLDACRRVAYENIEDLLNAGIDYAELRFSPYYMAMTHNLPIEGVVEAVIDGVNAGIKDFGIRTQLIGIMSRTFGVEACKKELAAILAFKKHFVAVDLAGDELGKPGSLFIDHFAQVKKTDLQVTVHAGEAAGPESIWQAIEQLGAIRIGHGVNAIKDNALLEYLTTNTIGIESCLTSNIQTSTVPSLSCHPLKQFLKRDILACINTDDPAVEGIELKHEYAIAASQVGLTQKEIQQAQLNGLNTAFLSRNERIELLEKAKNR